MKMLSGTMAINEMGHLEIGGCDTVDLVKQFGTPLYVMDEAQIRKRCNSYRQAFDRYYENFRVVYAGKAFLTKAMCRLIHQEGMGLDVVSGGELYTALEADFPPEKIIFHGNNKSEQEIVMALESGVGRLVADSYAELHLINELSARTRSAAKIYLRVNPDIEPDTHSSIQTGQLDSKFGFGIGDQVAEAVKIIQDLQWVTLSGLHCHIGSQLFDLEPFQRAAKSMMAQMDSIRQDFGLVLDELDLGGGMGIRYTEEDEPLSVGKYAQAITVAVTEAAKELNFPLPKILVEPGRSIVGAAGITLYTVGSVKEVPGVRKYVAVDGGMTSNMRPALYDAEYVAIVANRANDPVEETVSIAGKACESGDMLIWDIDLPKLRRNDILAEFSTGAYHYSMSSNYNRFPRPAVVFVRDGKVEPIVARETYANLVYNDIIPPHLEIQED